MRLATAGMALPKGLALHANGHWSQPLRLACTTFIFCGGNSSQADFAQRINNTRSQCVFNDGSNEAPVLTLLFGALLTPRDSAISAPDPLRWSSSSKPDMTYIERI